jgi:chemotaxis protein histidine kinase CheA/FixJ family two-component response regulator
VELDTIKRIAHSLEDIFKAICKPDLALDGEVEALLMQGYECLRLPLTAQLTGGQIDDNEVLDRAAMVFAQLQEKLGDCFTEEASIPSSVELGFDVTQSIFEVGVTQRLDAIAAVLAQQTPTEIETTLRAQAEVFLGLAESMNLPGFGAIARTAIAALDAAPDQVLDIAQTALVDWCAGRDAVLAGDRTQGGCPSAALLQLAGESDSSSATNSDLTEMVLGEFQETESNWDATEQEESDTLLEAIWGEQAIPDEPSPEPEEEPEELVTIEPSPSQTSTSEHSTPTASVAPTVRVKVEHLEHLNYTVGELLTNQNRQSLENEQLGASVQALLSRLQQHQQRLYELQEQSDPWLQSESSPELSDRPFLSGAADSHHFTSYFDALELDRYSHSQLSVQSLIDDAVQLAEAAEAIELFTTQSHQTLEKQRRLLTGTRDALMEARMLPLGEIFGRLPRVLQQLETHHDKSVTLEMGGTEVLVDKVVAQKLYDPLLHLVRNAFDHGIEPPEQRRQHGKSTMGLIEIHAYHRGRYLLIDIRDDGRGLSFEKIRQRASELIGDVERVMGLDETQLTDLLFEPGFSTSTQVSDLSGRGVGLDVVRAQIKALGGSITVDSRPYQGTTFTLHIPLSLSISKLLLCQAGSRVYALLDDAIEQILIPQPERLRRWETGKVLRWGKGTNEQLVPIYPLATELDAVTNSFSQSPHPDGEEKPILLVRDGDTLLGLEVDQLIGDEELAIRPLGSAMVPPDYVYGASILADGRLTLVIDGAGLVQHIADKQHQSQASWVSPSAQHLPPAPSQPQLPPIPYPALPGSPPAPVKAQSPATILLVDDSITVRQTLSLTLQKAGYQVVQAKDGEEAIAQLQRQSNIQLVICDIEMPRLNGFEFLKYRQQEPRLRAIPVVMLTSRSGEKHRVIATELGAQGYMTKPYFEHKLLATVADAIGSRGAEEQRGRGAEELGKLGK